MANRKLRRTAKTLKFNVDKAQVIEVGDFLFWDVTAQTLKPISGYTFTSDESTDQPLAKALFVGVSESQFDGKALHDVEIVVPHSCVFSVKVESSTGYDFGTMLAFAEDGTTDIFHDQTLQITTTVASAIGRVVKDYNGAARTEVEAVLYCDLDSHPEI